MNLSQAPWWLQLAGAVAAGRRSSGPRASLVFAQLGKRLLLAFIAALLAIAGSIALGSAAYLFLADWVGPPLSALIVALGVLAIAAGLFYYALRGARGTPPPPQATSSRAITPVEAEHYVRNADMYDLAARIAREVVPAIAKYRLLIWAGTASAVAVGSWLARRTRSR